MSVEYLNLIDGGATLSDTDWTDTELDGDPDYVALSAILTNSEKTVAAGGSGNVLSWRIWRSASDTGSVFLLPPNDTGTASVELIPLPTDTTRLRFTTTRKLQVAAVAANVAYLLRVLTPSAT